MAIKKIESINVIPFIDIMLVLLAIVLTTATFIAKGSIKVNLPQASAKPTKIEKPTEITLATNGKLYLNDIEIRKDKLLLNLAQTQKDRTITINGDSQMKYDYFVSTIDTLTAAGYTHISITTKRN